MLPVTSDVSLGKCKYLKQILAFVPPRMIVFEIF